VKGAGVKGVVFVCDVAALTRNASHVAEYVLRLKIQSHIIAHDTPLRHLQLIMAAISNLAPSQHPPPLLLFANKSDLLPTPNPNPTTSTGSIPKTPNTTLAISRLTTILERELEKRRQSSLRSAATVGAALNELGDGDNDAGEEGLGGLDISRGDTFTFEYWEGGEVSVRAGWVDVRRGGSNGEKRARAESDDDDDDDDESAHEKEGAREGKDVKKGPDGLAQLVDWIAKLP
jgi:hypothetical protein